jgi:hypothetical protein
MAHSTIDGGDAQTICHLLSRVFQQNTSLAHIYLPTMNINAEDMNLIVGGLMENMTMQLIDFQACTLDQGAWNRPIVVGGERGP